MSCALWKYLPQGPNTQALITTKVKKKLLFGVN